MHAETFRKADDAAAVVDMGAAVRSVGEELRGDSGESSIVRGSSSDCVFRRRLTTPPPAVLVAEGELDSEGFIAGGGGCIDRFIAGSGGGGGGGGGVMDGGAKLADVELPFINAPPRQTAN